MNFDVSGVSGFNPMGKAQGMASGTTTQKVPPGLKAVLDVFKINGPLTLQRSQGVQVPTPIAATLASIQMIQPSPAQMEALKALGLGSNPVLTLVVSDEDRRLVLKKRFREVSLSVVGDLALHELASILGTDIDEAVLDDNGALIMLNGIKELKKSIEEE